jgi:UDP-N-acetylmuramoylalanine--D-glutamate ligase
VSTGANYKGRTALIVGAGSSGLAATAFLLERGARVVLTDTQPITALEERLRPMIWNSAHRGLELVLELGGHRRESFAACDFVVLSPGVPAALPELEVSRAARIPILAEVELAARHLKGTILGITGSNGKTTTTTLLGEIMARAGFTTYTAGNIGVPLIGLVDGSTPEDVYATELSSFQLETIDTLRPHVAAILNLTPDHLDRYSGFEAYVAAKRRIFMNQTASDYAVLNADDPRTAALAAEVAAAPVWFSRRREVEQGCFLRGDRILFRGASGEHDVMARREVRLRGEHNVENALAAAAMALVAGAGPDSVRAAVAGFRGVEHRLEWVARIAGVEYFNDSKATNVDAAIKSLEAFPGGIHVILGGRDKAGDFTMLRPLVAERARSAVLIGEAADKIEGALAGTVPLERASSLPEAVEICRRRASSGDVVLLAPACASFDMFENYKHRGTVFKEAVAELRTAAK